ncbi:Serine/threonine-protein kinase ATM-like protein [Drosera capensis]
MHREVFAGNKHQRDVVVAYLSERLIAGNWLWHAVFCSLSRNCHKRMGKDLFVHWFNGISSNLEGILSEANKEHAYDGLLWTLRSLEELSSPMVLPGLSSSTLSKSSSTSNKIRVGWGTVWSSLMHALPLFSYVTPIVDAAFKLFGNLVLHDMINIISVPQDVWDLQCFKNVTLSSVLFFVSCYFSREQSQGNLYESLNLRQSLLRGVLLSLNLKEFVLEEDMVTLLPAASYALCAGYPLIPSKGLSFKSCGNEHGGLVANFEYFVDVLAKINLNSRNVVIATDKFQGLRLPQQLRDPLLQEMENCVSHAISDEKRNRILLSDVFLHCALLSNFIDGFFSTRSTEEISPFCIKVCKYLVELVESAVSIIQDFHMTMTSHGFSALNSNFDGSRSVIATFRSFVCCPLFSRCKDKDAACTVTYSSLIQSIERLLKAISYLYAKLSKDLNNLQSETDSLQLPDSNLAAEDSSPLKRSASGVIDMELDVSDSNDVSASGTSSSLFCSSGLRWRMDLISLISCCFSVLPVVTWDILFDIISKEEHPKLYQHVLINLCQNPHWSSAKLMDLVSLMNELFERKKSLKQDCTDVLSSIVSLLRTLLSLHSVRKDKHLLPSVSERDTEKFLLSLRDLVSEVYKSNLLDWHGRLKLVDCICDFISLFPLISQAMAENLIKLLCDPDYRVRLSLARRIGVLFQTWDGHDELFQDICSNFGVKLVHCSKDKIVTAKDVLADGRQASLKMETVVITLMHLAFHSEEVELEAVFMLCAIAAMEPSQRDLVKVSLDSLSTEMQYSSRSKYLDELMGHIIFPSVACGVSVDALIQIRDLFVSEVASDHFVLYCCKWLLPALILHDNTLQLEHTAKVANQSLAILVENHFVQIFSVCMALHCSKKDGWEKGTLALQSSILRISGMSEDKRDKLIKKYMVSIVSCILGLSSYASDPRVPLFSRETVERAVRAVVDGFLEVEDCKESLGVIDKINIFRPDRVFMFIVDIHYKVTAALNKRHRCHRLSALEVLMKILGNRVTEPSTSCYLLNLVGQFVSSSALQDQCCQMITILIKIFKSSHFKGSNRVLGEQLQLLVSKLVACCMPLESREGSTTKPPSQVLSLLHLLTVDSDPSLYDYVREFEPFPELDIFDRIRTFHLELCEGYSMRDHFLKFVKRSCYLPPRVLLWSLQELHRKLLEGNLLFSEGSAEDSYGDWDHDFNLVQAVWSLVHICSSDEAQTIRALVSDFVSRVGFGDPRSVVFHTPRKSSNMPLSRLVDHAVASDINLSLGRMSEERLVMILKILKKYLMDDSVEIVDLTSQTLRGILSTEVGQRALLLFDPHERSLIEVHSKGIDMQYVEKRLLDLEQESTAEAKSLEEDSLWSTKDKSFEMWICSLVFSLIGYSSDAILRFCQEILVLKSELAELLLPDLMVNLAGQGDLLSDLHQIISSQVQKHIFVQTNRLAKSIQAMLDTLNKLRLCYTLERSTSISIPSKRGNTKFSRSGIGYSPKTQPSVKGMDSEASKNMLVPASLEWDKVYWLSIDYLSVARSAISCGSFFSSMIYVEHWCEDHFNSLTLGTPDFSHREKMPLHIELLLSAVTQINEPDSLYGIIQSHKLSSQIITFEHEGNWSKALECYDLLVQSDGGSNCLGSSLVEDSTTSGPSSFSEIEDDRKHKKPFKGLIKSLQQIGCSHILDLYCHGLVSRNDEFRHDVEFAELQYEAAWRAGNWNFSLISTGADALISSSDDKMGHFNENLHKCLRALKEGDLSEFYGRLNDSKQELLLSISHASEESTGYIYSSIVKLQTLDHLSTAWDLRWKSKSRCKSYLDEPEPEVFAEPVIPNMDQLSKLSARWNCILRQTRLHMNLLEPVIALRRSLLQILGCKGSIMRHLLQSSSVLRKGTRLSQAVAYLHEFKLMCSGSGDQCSSLYWIGRLEEAKTLRDQGQHEMAINLGKYIAENNQIREESSEVHRLVGKWLAETRSSNSRTILDKYLKHAVSLSKDPKIDVTSALRYSQTHFHLAHYADALFRSHEERLNSSEWQAAMRLRKHKTMELEALIKRLRSSTKGEKTDYSIKIQELQKQLVMDKEEAEKLEDDRDNFLCLALDGYRRCLVSGDKYDVRVVFRLVSLWFTLSSRQNVINAMLRTIKEVQSYKFIPLVYQIASRLGNSKDAQGPHSFQFAVASLVKKLSVDHPYHTIFQLFALANGDRIKDKQRSRSSFVVDMDKKLAAEKLLAELSVHHGAIIRQTKQMVEVYIRLAELETRREVPVVTSNFPADRCCQYGEGSFPHFRGLGDSIVVMNGINAPKVIECFGSDGKTYRQLAKSGNDDPRQDAVMEQFFSLVNTFLRSNRDTWKRKLGVRTYKIFGFYMISTRNGGAHGRYGVGDWSFMKCREHMVNAKDKRKAFEEVCQNFRPVMHYFFLERFLQPADWFEKRLAYTRSVAASSVVGYIVGLGDRHAMNILIDQSSAEVVHIDLGVAFEQGLMLKTPERVPFRLTRDIIDGMGVTGVEGVFRRCCEETLSVMRTNKEALLTIVEVFIHDPLYKWALSPLKALERQKETAEDLETSWEDSEDDYEGNKDATRALLRVKQKLDGYEEGEMRSVHGQVQQLIQDAIDPERLAHMFPGADVITGLQLHGKLSFL